MPNSSTASWSRKSSLCFINVTSMEFLAAGSRWSRRASEPSRPQFCTKRMVKGLRRDVVLPRDDSHPTSW